MKKFLLIVSLLGISLTAGPVLALDLGIGGAQKAAGQAGYDAQGTTDTTLAQNIGGVIKSILTISGVIFTGLIFYAGYLWMLARGDEGQVQKSKDIIETAIVGLVISLASYGITNFVMSQVLTRTVPTGQEGPPAP